MGGRRLWSTRALGRCALPILVIAALTGCLSARMSPGPQDTDVYCGVEPPYAEVVDVQITERGTKMDPSDGRLFQAAFREEVRSYMERYRGSETKPLALRIKIVRTRVELPAPTRSKTREREGNDAGDEIMAHILFPLCTLTFVPFSDHASCSYEIWFNDAATKTFRLNQVAYHSADSYWMASLWPHGLLLGIGGNGRAATVFSEERRALLPRLEGQVCARAFMRQLAICLGRHAPSPGTTDSGK